MVFSFYLLEGENCRSADGSRRTGADIIVCPLATQETALANSDGEACGEAPGGERRLRDRRHWRRRLDRLA
ncbi:hypothetical protein BTE77_26425 [Ensifer adhaerens]|nr:hypothetical protein BTE77_26425 [Ensifer adhaerens]